MYYVYMVRCEDGSLYTGIAANIGRRLRQHLSRGGACARYTRAHGVVGLAGIWTLPGRAAASRLEYQVKRLTRPQKDALLRAPETARLLVPEDVVEAVDAAERERVWQATKP